MRTLLHLLRSGLRWVGRSLAIMGNGGMVGGSPKMIDRADEFAYRPKR